MSLVWWWRDEEADYVRAIQILKSDKPLALPAIKPLVAQRKQLPVWPGSRFDPDAHLGGRRE